VLLVNCHFFKSAEGPKTHIKDSLSLNVGELPFIDHYVFGVIFFANYSDHLIEVEIGYEITFENFETMLYFSKPMISSAD
jgi:hypothetical protein